MWMPWLLHVRPIKKKKLRDARPSTVQHTNTYTYKVVYKWTSSVETRCGEYKSVFRSITNKIAMQWPASSLTSQNELNIKIMLVRRISSSQCVCVCCSNHQPLSNKTNGQKECAMMNVVWIKAFCGRHENNMKGMVAEGVWEYGAQPQYLLFHWQLR